MTPEEIKIRNDLEEQRLSFIDKQAATFMSQANVAIRDAIEHPEYRRSHRYAAIVYMRAALAALDLQ